MVKVGEYYSYLNNGIVHRVVSMISVSQGLYLLQCKLIEDPNCCYVNACLGDYTYIHASEFKMKDNFTHLPGYNSQLYKAVSNA